MWSDKGAEEVIDYDFKFGGPLANMRDTIKTALVAFTKPEGAGDLMIGEITHDDTTVKAYISGGTPGVTYEVTCKVTTSAADPKSRTMTLTGKLKVVA